MPVRGRGHQRMSPIGARWSGQPRPARGRAGGWASRCAMCCRCRASGGRWGGGGESRGERTAPGDGAGGDAAARRGWRPGRSRRLRQSGSGGGCGEQTGRGCAVFARQSVAPAQDRLHRCFFMICFFIHSFGPSFRGGMRRGYALRLRPLLIPANRWFWRPFWTKAALTEPQGDLQIICWSRKTQKQTSS